VRTKLVEKIFKMVSPVHEVCGAQKPRTTFDCVKGTKDRCESLIVIGRRLQPQDFGLCVLRQFFPLDQAILQKLKFHGAFPPGILRYCSLVGNRILFIEELTTRDAGLMPQARQFYSVLVFLSIGS
jgi:hypothetical protein